MLSRVEVAYLGLLRVFLLLAATLALLVTIIATVSALPALGEITGISGNRPAEGASLSEFIRANQISDTQAGAAQEGTSDTPTRLTGDIAEASKNFARYDNRNGGEQLTQSQWEDVFRNILEASIPNQLHERYGSDVLALPVQLARSQGKPLSNQRLFELLDFHRDRFLEDAAANEAQKAASVAASMTKLAAAGIAFLIFVLICFNFIFVKIERNLRPQPRAGDQEGAAV